MKSLPKVLNTSNKRVGRGHGSGKGGHTVGRGTKGQKSRSNVGILFEGLKTKKSLYKRLPFLRGKGKFKANSGRLTINLKKLALIPQKSKVDMNYLVKHKLIKKKDFKSGAKIVGNFNIKNKLTVSLPASKVATRKIEKAGGKVVVD